MQTEPADIALIAAALHYLQTQQRSGQNHDDEAVQSRWKMIGRVTGLNARRTIERGTSTRRIRSNDQTQAELDGRRHELRLRREGQLVSAEVDERAYSLEFHNPGQRSISASQRHHVYHCRVESGGKLRNFFNVSLRGRDYAIQLVDPKRLRGSQSSGAHDHGTVQIVASMPGKVVRLMVELDPRLTPGPA